MDQGKTCAHIVVDNQGATASPRRRRCDVIIVLGFSHPCYYYCSKLDPVAPLLPGLLTLINRRAHYLRGRPIKNIACEGPIGSTDTVEEVTSVIVSHANPHPLLLSLYRTGFTCAPRAVLQ